MMWVCRAGKDSTYFDSFISSKIIALPWDGYRTDLSGIKEREKFKCVVKEETGSDNRTSISNWAGQMYSFCVEMQVGDYVLIPSLHSQYYVLAVINSEYKYNEKALDGLVHFRDVEIVSDKIRKSDLSQDVQFSLGAYRTVFMCKKEDYILDLAKNSYGRFL